MRWNTTSLYSGPSPGLPVRRVGPLPGAVGEADEVLDGAGSVVSEEVDDDVAVVGVQGGDGGVLRHAYILSEFCATPPVRGAVWQDGTTTSPADWEGPVSLSRKRKKELRKLQVQANNLWESQQVLVGEAANVAREARRQLGNYNREQVVPAGPGELRQATPPPMSTRASSSPSRS